MLSFAKPEDLTKMRAFYDDFTKTSAPCFPTPSSRTIARSDKWRCQGYQRRQVLNGSRGFDHGTASAALLAGAVSRGRIGEPLALDQLDEDNDFVATTLMDQYYATLADTCSASPPATSSPAPPPLQ